MKRMMIVALSAVLLTSCLDAGPKTDMYASQRQMPPNATAQCVSFVLVDDRCLREWYACRRGPDGKSCTSAWRECCNLQQGFSSRDSETGPL